MKRLNSMFAAFAVFATAALLFSSAPVSAQSSASLSIVPKKNYTVEPGKSVKDTLVVRNLDREHTLNLSLRVVDFTFTDDGGTPKLMLDEDAPQTTWSLKPFLSVPQTVSIEPRTSQTLDMSVAVPAGHGAGSYYSAIVYSSSAEEGGNVGLSASGVTLVFASVPGEVKEDLKLEKFGAYHLAESGKEAGYARFTMREPQSMAYTLKNSGNVTESPVGSITIRDIFGRDRVITDVNPNGSLALIDQTRTFTSCIQLKEEKVEFGGGSTRSTECTTAGLWPGFYRASLDLFYGQNGNRTQEITGNSWFVYLPMWFLIVLIVLILVIAYFVWRLVQKIRSPKTNNRIKSLRRK